MRFNATAVRRLLGVVAVGFMVAGTPETAGAQTTVYWADWEAAIGGQAGAAVGQLRFGDAGGDVQINYTGPLLGADGTSKTATNVYWTPASTYTSSTVANAPTGPDILAFNTTGAGVISFQEAVVNPTLAFLDLEQAGYEFDTDFTILSQGRGVYGNGTLSKVITPAGKYQLNGSRDANGAGGANGTIQFTGQFTSLPINSLSGEAGAGFDGITIGVTSLASLAPVPEPTGILATSTVVGVGLARLRRRLKGKAKAVPA